LAEATDVARRGFEASMDDDFNTAGALGHIFNLVKEINQARTAGLEAEPLGKAQETLQELTGVLGLKLSVEEMILGKEATPYIDLLVDVRQELRQAKQWELSDLVRDRLADLGIQIEDGKEGPTWHAI
jgi:cysteinyl-tRNA synthetase